MRSFKKVLKTVLLFLLLVVGFSVALITVFLRGENYFYQDAREREELSGTIDFLVCGTSHSLRAYKTNRMDQDLQVNSYNLSVSHVTMQGRSKLLQVELERNPVETVILEASYNFITHENDKGEFEGDFYVLSKLEPRERISYFFESIQPSEYIRFYYECLNNGFECLRRVMRGTWTSRNQVSEKGYVPLEGAKSQVADYASLYDTKTLGEELNGEDVECLQEILDYCRERGVEVILVEVPLPQKFLCQYSNLDVIREYTEQIAEENGISFYDFNLYKGESEIFSDETDFYDYSHFNDAGAEKFTELFTSVYDMAQNGEEVDDLFYDSYEEMKSHMAYSAGAQ